MNTWFEVKIKYPALGADGKDKIFTEVFLFDSINWTETETKTLKIIEEKVSSDYSIEVIKKTKYNEIFAFDVGDYWFKSIVKMITIDEASGKEKESKFNYLVNADDIDQALLRFKESLKETIVPYELISISLTNILEIFPYNN